MFRVSSFEFRVAEDPPRRSGIPPLEGITSCFSDSNCSPVPAEAFAELVESLHGEIGAFVGGELPEEEVEILQVELSKRPQTVQTLRGGEWPLYFLL